MATGNEVEFGTVGDDEKQNNFDEREDANDDLEKGRIKFPQEKLYGRDKELKTLCDLFSSFSSDGTSRVVFLGGYSGIGKSALIDHFIRQTSRQFGNATSFVSGKFDQLKTGDPFSAISQAMNQYIIQISSTSTEKQLKQIMKRLIKADIYLGSESTAVLTDTIVPALGDLLRKGSTKESEETEIPKASGGGSTGADVNTITRAFEELVKALAVDTQPMTMFIDDLQWADEASLQILTALLKGKNLPYLLFVGAYRDNEVNAEHGFSILMKEVEEARGAEITKRIKLENLLPRDIAEFIADSLVRPPEEVDQVAEAVYAKTLGNIFFVKQALEELVRKNAIYYDMVFYQWQFGDISRVQLDKFLTSDVIGMVQSKLCTLPEPLQKALALHAFANNIVEYDLLVALLKAEKVSMEPQGLHKMMYRAFVEGLVLSGDGSLFNGRGPGGVCSYKFAHDRIREAACESIPAGKQRDEMLLRICSVLIEYGSNEENDWMLFAAARHLNSIPANLSKITQVAELNLTVGKIAISKGAFSDAVGYLKAGIKCLGPSAWKTYYDITLDLKSTLAEAEYYTGHGQNALYLCEDTFKNAKVLTDKSRAHMIYIEALSKDKSDYNASVKAAVETLKLYGIDVPLEPTHGQVRREKMRYKLAFRGRSLMCLTKFPVSTDPFMIAQCKVAQKTIHLASKAKNTNLETLVGHRILREGLAKKQITSDFPFIAVMLGSPLRKEEKYESAIAFADAGVSLLNRFSEERSHELVKTKFALFGTLSCLRITFRDATEVFLALSKYMIAKGENEMGLASGMLGIMSFVNASLPLNSLIEPKLILLEETASKVEMKPFVTIFRMLRQFIYNLKGGVKSSTKSAELKGAALIENEVNYLFEGGAKKMMSRDMGILRIQLAVIFNDEAVMAEMIERLDEYPVYDLPIERQHLRMSFMGFAALILAPKTKGKKHSKWAKTSLEFFEKLGKSGSPNAQPVALCMKALDKPSVAAYDEAINICGNAGLLQLAAIMNEQCGIMLREKHPEDDKHLEYFRCAIWLYNDWGAKGKVKQMQTRYEFLSRTLGEKEPTMMAELRRNIAALGVPRGVDLNEMSEWMSSSGGSSIGKK